MTRSMEELGMASADPQLRRMLDTHIHCGEAMQVVSPTDASPAGPGERNDNGATLTYRCSCGFSFDEKTD